MLATLAVWALVGCAENARTSGGPETEDAGRAAADAASTSEPRPGRDAESPPDANAGDSTTDGAVIGPSDGGPSEDASLDGADGGDGADRADTSDADPCEPNPCDRPPAAACDDQRSLTFPGLGTCTIVASGASCEYPVLERDCTALGQICTGGVCADGPPRVVDWCRLQAPAMHRMPVGDTVRVFARVFVAGLTDRSPGPDGDPDLRAELGFGSAATPVPSWSFVAATANPDFAQEHNDEYFADLRVDAPGRSAYAYRFSVDRGTTWTYCDLDPGSTDGFDLGHAGTLDVVETRAVDWCRLQYPEHHAMAASESVRVYGRVFVDGLTNASAGPNPDPSLLAQVGYGSIDSTPPADWTFVDAVPNTGFVQENNDEYQADLSVTMTGSHAFAYRFSWDGGLSWTYCDAGEGTNDGYSPDAAGRLTITGAP